MMTEDNNDTFSETDAKGAAATGDVADKIALQRVLVAKGVCTWDELRAERVRAAAVAHEITSRISLAIETYASKLDETGGEPDMLFVTSLIAGAGNDLVAAYVRDGDVPTAEET